MAPPYATWPGSWFPSGVPLVRWVNLSLFGRHAGRVELNRTLRAACIDLVRKWFVQRLERGVPGGLVCREPALPHTHPEGGRCSNST